MTWVNLLQPPSERRAKYALAKSLGMTPARARRFRDTHTPKIFRATGTPLPELKKRKQILKQFGFINFEEI